MSSIVYTNRIFALQRWGGISRYFCELASRVHRTPAFDCRIVAPVHFNDHLLECDVPQQAHYLRLRGRTGRLYRAANRLLAPALTAAARPDLLHHTYYAPGDFNVSKRNIVTVYDMIHELFPGNFAPTDTTMRDKRQSVERADHVICISESTKADLVRILGVRSSKVSVTHLGYSAAFSHSESAGERRQSEARPYLLYVGQRAGYKGFDRLIEAYASSSVLCSSFDLIMFGGPGFDVAEKAMFAKLGLREGSLRHVTGDDYELAKRYRAAWAFIYPSLYEGFGIPLLEAMSSGCPVACSNTSSIPEVVGEAAELFDPSDVESMRIALERVCLDEARRSELVAAGTKRSRLFSWDRCARETALVYAQLL